MPVDFIDSGDGGGGIGGGGLVGASYVSPTPVNSYIDILNPGSYVSSSVFMDDPGVRNIYYTILTENGSLVNQRINLSGSPISSSLATYTEDNTISTSSPSITRLLSGIGQQSDRIVLNIAGSNAVNQIFNYVTLQQAIPVTKIINTGTGVETGLSNGSNTNITTGTAIRLSKVDNRGDEVSSTWVIRKSDPAGSFTGLTAILGVDYELLNSTTLSTDILDINFLTSYNFTIRNEVSGYTFASNPYYTTPGDITSNIAFSTHNFITSAPTFYYEVKFPLVTPILTADSENITSSNPLSIYQNQNILVDLSLDIPTGYFKQKFNSSPTVNTIVKTENEWKTEIINRCNVTLEARDFTTNELVYSKTAVPPFSFNLSDVRAYKILIILTEK